MAVPTTKSTFKSYCLRALGDGVIDIIDIVLVVENILSN